MIAKELRVARTVMFVALLTTIFGGSIGCGMTNGQSNQDTGIPSLQVLNEVASEVNKSLPMMIDGDTELMNVVAVPEAVVYNYRFVNFMASEIDTDATIEDIRSDAVTQACTTPATRDAFLTRGVTMRYQYHDKVREYIGEFDVTPTDCGF